MSTTYVVDRRAKPKEGDLVLVYHLGYGRMRKTPMRFLCMYQGRPYFLADPMHPDDFIGKPFEFFVGMRVLFLNEHDPDDEEEPPELPPGGQPQPDAS